MRAIGGGEGKEIERERTRGREEKDIYRGGRRCGGRTVFRRGKGGNFGLLFVFKGKINFDGKSAGPVVVVGCGRDDGLTRGTRFRSCGASLDETV